MARSRNENGEQTCGCPGKTLKPCEGTQEEHAGFGRYQFSLPPNVQGNKSYCGPSGQRFWLYDDGTWDTDAFTSQPSLQEFLEGSKNVLAHLARM